MSKPTTIKDGPVPLYDGYAEDYDDVIDEWMAVNGAATQKLFEKMLAGLKGRCLDVACGTGINGPMLNALGFKVTGVDISQDQLNVATSKGRISDVVLANAEHLPFEDNSFDVVISSWAYTDFENWEAVVSEITRLLIPNGHFVIVGAHPAFWGPHAEWRKDDNKILMHPGYYLRTERLFKAPGFSAGGIRERVGAKHVSLEALLRPLLTDSLDLVELHEATELDPPLTLGVKVRKVAVYDTSSTSKPSLLLTTRPKVTVYCGWSPEFGEEFQKLAFDMGELLGKSGYDLVYGGSAWGMMGKAADGMRAGGGKVIGVTTPEMAAYEGEDLLLDQTVMCRTMAERKYELYAHSDAIIALPGGLGTLDEMIEVITLRVKNLFAKPVVLVNYDGYFDDLISWLTGLADKKYIPEDLSKLIIVTTPEAVLQALAEDAAKEAGVPLHEQIATTKLAKSPKK